MVAGTISLFCILAIVAVASVSCKSAGKRNGALKSITDKGFKYERIQISIKSKDGLPLEGVKAKFSLDAMRFEFDDPNSTTPGISPGFYDSFAKGGDLGSTDSDGKIELRNVIYESKYNQPTRLTIKIENSKPTPCDPARATSQDRWYYKTYGEFSGRDDASKDAAGKCGATMAHDASDPNQLEIECSSDKSYAELKSYQDEAYKRSCLSR